MRFSKGSKPYAIVPARPGMPLVTVTGGLARSAYHGCTVGCRRVVRQLTTRIGCGAHNPSTTSVLRGALNTRAQEMLHHACGQGGPCGQNTEPSWRPKSQSFRSDPRWRCACGRGSKLRGKNRCVFARGHAQVGITLRTCCQSTPVLVGVAPEQAATKLNEPRA